MLEMLKVTYFISYNGIWYFFKTLLILLVSSFRQQLLKANKGLIFKIISIFILIFKYSGNIGLLNKYILILLYYSLGEILHLSDGKYFTHSRQEEDI